ncbi:MAG: hypothetical protein WBE68_02680 [Candidatus Nitrosopolaris sp.]
MNDLNRYGDKQLITGITNLLQTLSGHLTTSWPQNRRISLGICGIKTRHPNLAYRSEILIVDKQPLNGILRRN